MLFWDLDSNTNVYPKNDSDEHSFGLYMNKLSFKEAKNNIFGFLHTRIPKNKTKQNTTKPTNIQNKQTKNPYRGKRVT